MFRKSFTPHYNWKVTSRLLGYFTKILQKFFRYNWFFADGSISVFSKNLKPPPYILDICIPVCGGVSQNFWKKSPTIIGNFKEKSKWSTQNFSRKKLLSHYNWTLAARNLTVYRKLLLTIYGHLHTVWRGIFEKNKSPPTYIGKLQCFCWGISPNFCKKNFFHLTKDTKNRKFGVYKKIFLPYITRTRKFYS